MLRSSFLTLLKEQDLSTSHVVHPCLVCELIMHVLNVLASIMV